jgi:hypothetical protein
MWPESLRLTIYSVVIFLLKEMCSEIIQRNRSNAKESHVHTWTVAWLSSLMRGDFAGQSELKRCT